MERLFITGDTHGTIDFSKLNRKNFTEQKNLTKKDVVIITGDTGLCWDNTKVDKHLQNWYSKKKFTTLAVDGNHENHDLIMQLPVIEKFGGKVRKISDNVFYAIRGEIYEIADKKILCIGGADSKDKKLRIEGLSWWAGETISDLDIKNAQENLLRYNNTVDYIISHTCGTDVCSMLGFNPTPSDKHLDILLQTVDYKYHYCGHMHIDKLYYKTRILYNDIIEPAQIIF